MNVKTQGCKVTLILYEKTFKTALEEMPTSKVLTVEPDCVAYSQPLNRVVFPESCKFD